MCMSGLLGIIVLDNGTQFSSATVIDFCKDIWVQTKFVFVVHPHVNGWVELANKIILKGIKKKLDEAKCLWAKQLHELLWSYHTTHYSTTGEIIFKLVYRANTMLSVKIDTSAWRHSHLNEEENEEGLRCIPDLVDKIRDVAHILESAAKQRATMR